MRADMVRVSDWHRVASKPGGKNPGAFYIAPNGERYLVKGSIERLEGRETPAIAKMRSQCEVLTSKLLKLAGVKVADTSLIDLGDAHGGGVGIASRFVAGTALNIVAQPGRQLLQQHFGAFAWLGFVDAGRPGNAVQANAAAIMVDMGDALLFSPGKGLIHPDGAMTATVEEWAAMSRPISLNQMLTMNQGADSNTATLQSVVFSTTPPETIAASVRRVRTIDDAEIRRQVALHGPDDQKICERMIGRLIARKEWIAAKTKPDLKCGSRQFYSKTP